MAEAKQSGPRQCHGAYLADLARGVRALRNGHDSWFAWQSVLVTPDLPTHHQVPLPAPVDDWVIEQMEQRRVSFQQLAQEALDGRPDAVGEGLVDQVTAALILVYMDTGGELSFDDDWRRVPPTSEAHRAKVEVDRERRASGYRRHRETIRQLQNHEGEDYEKHRSITDAYRAAGSPRHVYRTWSTPPRFWVRQRGNEIPVTEAEWDIWRAWEKERQRLRGRSR